MKIFEPVAKSFIVLKCKNGGRHKNSCLLSIQACFESCADSNFGFAKSYVTANKPVHWRWRLHVFFYICSCLALVWCVLVNERSLQFRLHVIVRSMGKT